MTSWGWNGDILGIRALRASALLGAVTLCRCACGHQRLGSWRVPEWDSALKHPQCLSACLMFVVQFHLPGPGAGPGQAGDSLCAAAAARDARAGPGAQPAQLPSLTCRPQYCEGASCTSCHGHRACKDPMMNAPSMCSTYLFMSCSCF